MPAGASSERGQGEALITERPAAQGQVEQSLHPSAGATAANNSAGSPPGGLTRRATSKATRSSICSTVGSGTGVHHGRGDGREPAARSPLVAFGLAEAEDRWRPARGVAHGQGREDHVVVVAGERRRCRRDDVGVPRGLSGWRRGRPADPSSPTPARDGPHPGWTPPGYPPL